MLRPSEVITTRPSLPHSTSSLSVVSSAPPIESRASRIRTTFRTQKTTRLGASQRLSLAALYHDYENRYLGAGDFLFMRNLSVQFWSTFNAWNFRYWVMFLFLSFVGHLTQHLVVHYLLKDLFNQQEFSVEAPFSSWAGTFYFVISPGIWFLGGLILIIWRTTKHAHTVVAVTSILVVISEFVILAAEGYNETTVYALPVPIMLVAVGLTARLIPSVATLTNFVLLIGTSLSVIAYTAQSDAVASYLLQLWAGIACHWFVFGLCLVGGTNILRAQSDLFSALNDRLVFRKKDNGSYELALHGVSHQMIEYFKKSYNVFFFKRFPRTVDEQTYRVWYLSRHTYWITHHSRWAVIGFILLLVAMIFAAVEPFRGPNGEPDFAVYAGIAVQVLSAVMLLVAGFIAMFSYGRRRRLMLSAMMFLLACCLFSCVYVYNFDRSARKSIEFEGSTVFYHTVWDTDPGLFTIIATHITMSHMGYLFLLFSDCVVTLAVTFSALLWLDTSSAQLVVAGLVNFLLMMIMGFLYTLAIDSHWRLLFALTRDPVPTNPSEKVVIEGWSTEYSERTMYYITVKESEKKAYKVLVSAAELRSRLVSVQDSIKNDSCGDDEWTQYIDTSLDCLDDLSDGVGHTRARRLETVLNGVVATNPQLIPILFPRAEGDNVPRMNITLITVGSRGDVQPFMSLAKALNAHGHRSRICTHDKFRDFVTKQGIEFFPLALAEKGHWQPETLMRYAEENPGMGPDLLLSPRDLYHFMFHGPEMQNTLREIYLPPGWENNTVGSWAAVQSVSSMRWVTHAIIANPPSYTHVHLAERLGVPLQMFFTMPWTKTEAVGHPLCVNEPDTNPYWKKMSYRWMEQIQWRGVASAVNTFRRQVLHLPSIGMWHGAGSLIDKWGVPFAYCFAETLLPKPADWGPNIDITGFCFGGCGENTTYVPPPQLAAFLEAGSPPFYVGFGSISGDLSPIYRAVLAAVKAIPEMRVILHKGWCDLSGLTQADFTEDIRDRVFLLAPPPEKCPVCKEKGSKPLSLFCEDCALTSDPSAAAETWEYQMIQVLGDDHVALLPGIPHDWLFPRCCACMHHGGAGTTAMGLDCGLPTAVVAFFGDQPLWGGLVEVQGGGKMVLARHVSDEKITEAMEYCLGPDAKKAAMKLKKGLADERADGQGAEAGAGAFEHQLPLELVTCEVCSMRNNEEVVKEDKRPRAAEFTEVNKNLKICPVCALALQYAGENIRLEPLRTADWARTRGGILYVHFVRWLKSFIKLFRRMIQGGQEGGVGGFFIGVVVGVFEFIVFVIVAPFIFIRDLFRVATQIVVPTNGSSHCGYKIEPSTDFLQDMVLISSARHGVSAVNISTLTDEDHILTKAEAKDLEMITVEAVQRVKERRKEEETLTDAVCSLIAMRGVGMELTATQTVHEVPDITSDSLPPKEAILDQELGPLPGDFPYMSDDVTIEGFTRENSIRMDGGGVFDQEGGSRSSGFR